MAPHAGVVPQFAAHRAEHAWGEWVDRDGAGGPAEGLVLVALDAPLERRGAKRKVRLTTTLDVVVLDAGKGAIRVAWRGYSFAISAVGRRLSVGDVAEIECTGWNEKSVQPRNARVVRVREDLRRAA